VDVIELLKDLDVKYATPGDSKHVSHGWVGLVCPFCDQGAGNYGLGINLENGKVTCWKCGGHYLSHVLAVITGRSEKDCARLVKGLEPATNRFRVRKCGAYEAPTTYPLGRAHKDYLNSRLANSGFKVEDVELLWGLKATSDWGWLNWRIFIPITLEGNPVSWTTRHIGTDGQRYVTAGLEQSSVPPKDVLYGADIARNAISVHEGPVDAWCVGVGGTCTLGVGYSNAQVRQVAQFQKRVICFDSEPEAQKRARKLCADLAVFPGETINVMLQTGKDAASCSARELRRLRALLA